MLSLSDEFKRIRDDYVNGLSTFDRELRRQEKELDEEERKLMKDYDKEIAKDPQEMSDDMRAYIQRRVEGRLSKEDFIAIRDLTHEEVNERTVGNINDRLRIITDNAHIREQERVLQDTEIIRQGPSHPDYKNALLRQTDRRHRESYQKSFR